MPLQNPPHTHTPTHPHPPSHIPWSASRTTEPVCTPAWHTCCSFTGQRDGGGGFMAPLPLSCCPAQARPLLRATHQLSIPGCHIHHYRAPDQMAPAQQLKPALGSMRCHSGSGSKLAAASRQAATAEAVAVPCRVQDGPELPLALQGMCNSGGGQVGGSGEAWVWHESRAGSRGSCCAAAAATPPPQKLLLCHAGV